MRAWWLAGACVALGCADATDLGEDGATGRDAAPLADAWSPPLPLDIGVGRDSGLLEGGEECADEADCRSGYCLQFEDGRVCSDLCAGGDCPEGWSCKSVVNAGADVVFICVPDRETLCQACANNTDCGELGDMCVASPDGRVCGRDCSVTNTCPEGYVCGEVVDPAGTEGRQCVPESGQCSCRPDQVGDGRDCARQNEFGACNGVQTCAAEGWTPCSAQDPAPEECDGLDNDCDGRLDEGLDPQPCDGTPNPFGSCTGVERCEGAMGWVCDAPAAEAESCDGVDNDCNGEIDDGLCFDGNPCTRDVCDAELGCSFPAAAGPCDDGSACTEMDRCVDGECAGSPIVCEDDNPCTGDVCDPVAGCTHPNLDGAPCDTGDRCTVDRCQAAVCVRGAPVVCNSNNACLRDMCDPERGCVTEPLTGNPCDDDDGCTVREECSNGQCVGGDPYCAGRPCVNNCAGDANLAIDGICIDDVPLLGTTCFCVCL